MASIKPKQKPKRKIEKVVRCGFIGVFKYSRQAHNLKVVGSNPTPATNFKGFSGDGNPFFIGVFSANSLNSTLSGDSVKRLIYG